MLELYLSAINKPQNGLNHAEKNILNAILSIAGVGGKCWASNELIAASASYSLRRTVDILSDLTNKALLIKTAAADDPLIPKKFGYCYVLNLPAVLALGCATPAPVQGLHSQAPDPAETSQPAKSKRRTPKAAIAPVQPLPTSRSTSTSTKSGDRVGGGSASRACEATDGLPTATPTKAQKVKKGGLVETAAADVAPDQAFKVGSRAPSFAEDETDRNALREAIIASLPQLDAELMRAAMKQNTSHLQYILDNFKLDVTAACEWSAYKAPDIWTRMDACGQRLQEPAVSKLLAKDAESESALWLSGKHKKRSAAPQAAQAPAVEQLAAEPQAEHVPAEEPAREPVKLGAVVAELVPAVTSAARRTPQPAEEAGERPAWWQQLVRAFGADVSVSLAASACAGPLMRATVRLRGGRLLIERSRELLQHEVELLDLHAAEWMAAIAKHASDAAGQRLTVCWGTRSASPALPVAPREVPTWWPQLIARLRASAASHAASRAPDAATTAKRFELVADTLQAARRAVWSGHVLTVEVDALGQLAQASAVVCAAIGWAVALELDLPDEAEVVLVDLSQGEEVWA